MRYRYEARWCNARDVSKGSSPGDPLPKGQRIVGTIPYGMVFVEHEVPFRSRIGRVKKRKA